MLQNIAAERTVIGSLMQYGIDANLDIEDLIDVNSFTIEENQVLYNCIQHSLMSHNQVSIPNLLSAAHELGLSDFINQKDVIDHLKAINHTKTQLHEVRDYAAKIRRLQFAREIKSSVKDIYQNISEVKGNESLSDILNIAESPIQDLCLKYQTLDHSKPCMISDGLDEYIQDRIDNPCQQVGISTGIDAFDYAIGGGLRRKCVDLVAARSKAGKSIFVDNVAIHIAGKSDIPVLVLDTEMDQVQHWNRILANLSNVETRKIETGRFAKDPADLNAVRVASEQLKNMPYTYASISGKPPEEVLSIVRRWLLSKVGYDDEGSLNDCVVMYDYLKLMTGGSINNNMSEYQILGFMITSLHNFAVKYDFPCLAFVQTNREGITKEDESVVSGSDRLIWLSTSCTLLKVKSDEEIAVDGKRLGNRKMVNLTTRHGPGLPNDYICLDLDGAHGRLTSLGTRNELVNKDPDAKKDLSTEIDKTKDISLESN